MSYIAPQVKEKFDTLSVGLRNIILERDVQINTIHDLIRVLGDIVKEGEAEEQPVIETLGQAYVLIYT